MNGYLKDMGHFFAHGVTFYAHGAIFFAHYCISLPSKIIYNAIRIIQYIKF